MNILIADISSAGERAVAIFGSCVSRDAFALAPVDGCAVGTYVARSSFAIAAEQAVTAPAVLAGLERIESAFQRRMVGMDLGRRGLDELAAQNRQESGVRSQESGVRSRPDSYCWT